MTKNLHWLCKCHIKLWFYTAVSDSWVSNTTDKLDSAMSMLTLYRTYLVYINCTILSVFYTNNIHFTVLCSLITITFLLATYIEYWENICIWLFFWVSIFNNFLAFLLIFVKKRIFFLTDCIEIPEYWYAFSFFTPNSLYHPHFQHHAADCSSAVLAPYQLKNRWVGVNLIQHVFKGFL